MKNNILEIIAIYDGKLNFKHLEQKLNLDKNTLKNLLQELKFSGQIVEMDGKYSLLPEDMYIGKISISKSAHKVIFHNGHVYPLTHEYHNSLLLNDTVTFTINDKSEAVITSIIDRELHDVTCQVKVCGKKKKLECFHQGINVEIPEVDLEPLKDGDIILVSIGLNDLDCTNYKCTFKSIIGNASEPNIDELTIAMNYGFDNNYSKEYLEELNNIPTYVKEEECQNRKDLRHLDFITIDGIDAKDMDDAVYGEKIDKGYRLYVSISDVSHYVKYGTEIFKRAFEKGNSYYANNIVFHMLHALISNGICSLNPNVDRLTKTVIIDIDYKGNILSYDIVKSVIHSRIKTNYDDVDKLLIDNICINDYKPYEELLKTLNEASKILEHKALNINGKLNFPSDEVNKTYDEEGNVLTISDMNATPARKLIEYFMITANECVAQYLHWAGIPSIFRIHDIPDLKKVNKTLKEINESDAEIKFKKIDSVKKPHVIQAILHKLSNLDEYPILASLLLQSMQRAEYSTENIGHYALDLEFYTHFTSPIRRLCDLLIHMLLDILLEDYEYLYKIDFKAVEQFLQEVSRQASRMERQADAGEYESSRLAIIKSMQKDIGEEFEALVLEVGNDIRIKVNGIDTYVKFKYVSDNIGYDSSNNTYYDKYNNKILKLGSKVIVKLLNTNLNTRTINVEILGVKESNKLKRI